MFKIKYYINNEIHDAGNLNCQLQWEDSCEIELWEILNHSRYLPEKIYFLVKEGSSDIFFSVQGGELIPTPTWLAERYKR